MNKQQLANKIWESANKMRSKIEANEYKDYILGFIFYKYLSEKEEDYLRSIDMPDESFPEVREDNEDFDYVGYLQNNIGYFIGYDNLFSTWLKKGKDFDVSNVRDALSAFNRLINPTHKKLFEKIFETLDTGLSKLGDSSGAQTKAISNLLQLIKDIPMDGKQGYDVLGFIYEYLISQFAANAGKKAGEFYTPHEVAILMSEIVSYHLKGHENIKIYDPTSGSGSLLITIGKAASKYMDGQNQIKYFAQELKENTYNLTRMNLVMRGILPENIVTRNGDTLEEDWPYFDEHDPQATYEPLYVDAVVSNPPYSQAWDPTDKENDVRYRGFGLAPKGKADYAFLLHDLYHVKPDGIMTIVLPHGVLFRGGEEGTIRKNLIEQNHIDTIIGLPANIFFGTGIPTIIMVLKKEKTDSDILFIDGSKGFVKEGKNNKLRASDIKRIVDAYINRKDIDKFAHLASKEEIKANDYNLNIPRYVDSSDKAESWDIYATMFGGIPESELAELNPYWQAFPSLKDSILRKNEGPYYSVSVDDISESVRENSDVVDFRRHFAESFITMKDWMRDELLVPGKLVNATKEEGVIADELFARLESIPLVDKYNAYQILDDCWTPIASDLEVLQTEGLNAARIVDPRMVLKKKNGQDQEVQDGWIGRVLPLDLVQKVYMQDEMESLQKKTARLDSIPGELEEILGDLTEDEREKNIFNDEGDAFVSKEVSKLIKELKKDKYDPESKALLQKLLKVDALFAEERRLKSDIKKTEGDLTLKTKTAIENLSDDDVYMLLEKKWIEGFVVELNNLPDTCIDTFISALKSLSDKYGTTMMELEEDIQNTEKELCAMLDDLVGSEYDMKGIEEFKHLLMGV